MNSVHFRDLSIKAVQIPLSVGHCAPVQLEKVCQCVLLCAAGPAMVRCVSDDGCGGDL